MSATNSNLKDLGYVGGQTTDSMTPVVTNESVEKLDGSLSLSAVLATSSAIFG
ncbi:hypothetical protein AAAC51_37295 [Priestia megaterium]